MRRVTQLTVASFVALSLGLPAEGWAQASRRGGGSDSSGSSSSGGGSPRSAGGDGGGSSSAPQSEPRVARPRSGGSASESGPPASSQGTSATRSPASSSAATARARGARAGQGEAQPRQFWRPAGNRPTYIVRSYYPWYGYGHYDPWYGYGYGYNSWSRYPYGVGIGVFGYPYGVYDPYYDPYGYGGGYAGSYSRRQEREDDDRRPTGSIRVKANRRDARVYVDGALVGTVDEFDGLSDHLELEAGTHQLEIRAEGHETYTTDITVRAGRTVTARANLRELN